MSRIHIVDPKSATGNARTLLEAVQSQLGVTPDFRFGTTDRKAA